MLRRFIAPLFAIAGLTAAPPALAQDSFTNTLGGFGGAPFTLRCPPGTVMTGLVAFTGAYVDGITPICDRTALSTGAGHTQGGRVARAQCPAGSYVEMVNVFTLRSENRLVDSLQLFCRGRANNQRTGSIAITTPDGSSNNQGQGPFAGSARCPFGTFTVGLQGAAGKSIDRVGLICGQP